MKGSFNLIMANAATDCGLPDRVRYTHKEMEVISFRVRYFPGQCGARILYDFYVPNDDKDWWQDFTDDLKEWGSDHSCKLVATAVDDEHGPNALDYEESVPLHRLLKTTQWEHGSSAKNPNSDNHITIFELTTKEQS